MSLCVSRDPHISVTHRLFDAQSFLFGVRNVTEIYKKYLGGEMNAVNAALEVHAFLPPPTRSATWCYCHLTATL